MAVEVKLFGDLDAAAADAGAALGREAQASLFDRLDWFRLVHEHTPEGDPLVIRAKNGVARCWLFLSVQGRSAEALSNWYCLRYGVVTQSENGASGPVGEISRGLRQAGISRIFLAPLPEGDPLEGELRRRGWAVRRAPVNVNWRIDTKGLTFDEYWTGRPSRLRNSGNRAAKKQRLDLAVLDRFDAAAWADYESVYAASWKPSEGSPALVRRMAEQEGAAGTLRLGVAYHEGRPVAAQMWTVENGAATIHKLAYREDARDLSPGTVLSMAMFRRALDVDKVDAIDFGIGDHPYKAEWMSEKAPLYALSAYDMLRPSGLAGLAGVALRKLAARLPRRRPA